jgi:hypothetical protein
MWLGSEQAMNDHAKLMAKRGLGTYCHYLLSTLQEKPLKDKIKDGDRGQIEKAVQSTLDWLSCLDENNLAEEAEFEAKQHLLDCIVHPIMQRANQAADVEPGQGASSASRAPSSYELLS